MPGVLAAFERAEYPVVNLCARLFLSLFSHSLPEETSYRVLDLFFLEGLQSNKIIFDVTFAYLSILEEQIVVCQDHEQMQKVLNPNNPSL